MPAQALLALEIRHHRDRVDQLWRQLCVCTAPLIGAAAIAELDALDGDDEIRFGSRYSLLADAADLLPRIPAERRTPCICEWAGLRR